MNQTPTQKILKAYEESQTLTGIHKITGYNWQRIAKTLSTEGIVVNETQALIIDLHYRGKSAGEISTITGFATSTVMAINESNVLAVFFLSRPRFNRAKE